MVGGKVQSSLLFCQSVTCPVTSITENICQIQVILFPLTTPYTEAIFHCRVLDQFMIDFGKFLAIRMFTIAKNFSTSMDVLFLQNGAAIGREKNQEPRFQVQNKY